MVVQFHRLPISKVCLKVYLNLFDQLNLDILFNFMEEMMREQEARTKIEQAGGDWEVFWKWMAGQTVGMNDDGTVDIYDCDVDNFIRIGCNPENEFFDWD